MRIPSYLSAKIRDAYINQLSETKRKRTSEELRASGSDKAKVDEIILSSRAAEIHKAEELSKKIPDIRQEKVDAIKEQIESKKYNVNEETVAESIIDLFR